MKRRLRNTDVSRSILEKPCACYLARQDGCSANVIAVVSNGDGSYSLEWGDVSHITNERILRAAIAIMKLYDAEVKANQLKEKTYDEEQSELLNKQLETTTHGQTKQRINT